LAARADLELRVIYQAELLSGWDVDPDWFARAHAYDARVLSSRQRARAGRSPVVVPRRLGEALNAFGPDVVVVWEFGPAALLATVWCSRHRGALVHLSELGECSARSVPPPQRLLHGLLVRRAAAAIGVSTQARDRLVALGSPPARTFVSLQSVDAAPIRAAAAARVRDSAHGPIRLLCVARLVPDKNIDALIEAVASAGRGEIVLDVIGEGPLRGLLQTRAAAVGANVRFLGGLSPADTAQAYARADVLALVSRHEPFGVALREGVAAGLPLIASERAGATGDVAVAQRNAIVVDPDDDPAIAAAVRRLARDPALREEMGAASREIDREWPLERSVEAFARAVHAARDWLRGRGS
jgi:glycosyltransferase involved in cell wall biosynthesis